jgi:hypothetical protein
MAFCPSCGSMVGEGGRFCPACGAQIGGQPPGSGGWDLRPLLEALRSQELCSLEDLRGGKLPALNGQIDAAAALLKQLLDDGRLGEAESLFSGLRSNPPQAKVRMFSAQSPTRQSWEDAAHEIEKEMIAEGREKGQHWCAVLDEVNRRAGCEQRVGRSDKAKALAMRIVETRAAIGPIEALPEKKEASLPCSSGRRPARLRRGGQAHTRELLAKDPWHSAPGRRLEGHGGPKHQGLPHGTTRGRIVASPRSVLRLVRGIRETGLVTLRLLRAIAYVCRQRHR